MSCCVNLHPEIKVARNYKTKENTVVCYVKENFPFLTWIADRKVADGCSKRRPDLLVDLGTHILVIEVDENQHTVYDCSCEHKRLMELSQDVGHRSIVFLRFNPDGYTNSSGDKIHSPWRLNKIGVMTIVKTRADEWSERLNILKATIQYWIDNESDKMIEIVELFY